VIILYEEAHAMEYIGVMNRIDIVAEIDKIDAVEEGLLDPETLEAHLDMFLKESQEGSEDFARFAVCILLALCAGAVAEVKKTMLDLAKAAYHRSPEYDLGIAAFLAKTAGDLKPDDEPLVVLRGILERRTTQASNS
jgi:hypothetical protein